MPISSIDSHSNAGSSDVSHSDDGALPFPMLKTLPDLRFEQSYLASIKGYVHELDKEAADDIKEERQDEKDAEKGNESSDEQPHHIMKSQDPKGEHELWLGSLRIEWYALIYSTVRDQFISPLVQGAVWGLGGLALSHVQAYMRARRETAPVGRVPRGRGSSGPMGTASGLKSLLNKLSLKR